MKSEKWIKKLGITFFLLVISFNVGSVVLSHWPKYATFDYWKNFPILRQEYLSSQYVNKHPKGWMPDEIVNAYAGGAYIRGIQPQFIAPDTPPLGRYLIGVSAFLFNNANSITLISAATSLFMMFLVGKQIFRNTLFALIPPTLFSFEPIFKNQLIYTPLLDIMQLVFLLFALYFFNKSFSTKHPWTYFIATSVSIGLFISTKFFITGITIIAACVIVLLIHKYFKNTIAFLTTLPISICILLLTYVSALFSGYSLKSFLGIQKWIFLYHKSQLILPFSIWPLLMVNKWHVWFGNTPIISDDQWSITWPIVTILSFATIVLYLFKITKRNNFVEILMTWSTLYVLFFSFGQITSRYFVILIPIFYIITTFGIVEIGKKLYENRH